MTDRPRGGEVRLILGDQLSPAHPWFAATDREVTYLMVEARGELTYAHHHRQKAAAFLAAMRAFADGLERDGHRVRYLRADDPGNAGDLGAQLAASVEEPGASSVAWREHVRGIYWAHMPDYAARNHLGHTRPLPSWYWTGEVEAACLRACVNQSLDTAYAHHIQRLMVLGNFALLAGCDPDEVDAWYLGVYVDAVEWAQLPNTRGMSQFADGGLLATKPYVSAAAYIRRMSDHCQGCRYDPKQRTGPDACPFNSLYWDFHARHRETLASIPRIGQVWRTWERWDEATRAEIRARAAEVLDGIEEL